MIELIPINVHLWPDPECCCEIVKDSKSIWYKNIKLSAEDIHDIEIVLKDVMAKEVKKYNAQKEKTILQR